MGTGNMSTCKLGTSARCHPEMSLSVNQKKYKIMMMMLCIAESLIARGCHSIWNCIFSFETDFSSGCPAIGSSVC